MAEIEIPRPLADDDTLRFIDSHRPALKAATYTATVVHTLRVAGREELKATRALTFAVAAQRFGLGQGDVVSAFPQPGASGDFSTVLPHILLRRASLPWERSAVAGGAADSPPWLALLVLAEGEFSSTTMAATTLLATTSPAPATDPFFQPLPAGPADDRDQKVSVIDIDAALADQVLPQGEALGWLAGVRDVNGADPRALVVASRLPVARRLALSTSRPPPGTATAIPSVRSASFCALHPSQFTTSRTVSSSCAGVSGQSSLSSVNVITTFGSGRRTAHRGTCPALCIAHLRAGGKYSFANRGSSFVCIF